MTLRERELEEENQQLKERVRYLEVYNITYRNY